MVSSRLPALVIAVVFGLGTAVTLSGCPHPYSGKPERLKKPRRKRGAPEATATAVAAGPAKGDDRCRTNFFAEPTERRSSRAGKRKAAQADKLLVRAEKVEIEERGEIINEAIETLSAALRKDPYGPLPTYKLAVAYALVNKTGCAVALLERLSALQSYTPVAGEAKRTVQQAMRDIAFDDFREEADGALKNK